jgi:hypothetical protein
VLFVDEASGTGADRVPRGGCDAGGDQGLRRWLPIQSAMT